jgi:lysophospholipase L1-like esterase
MKRIIYILFFLLLIVACVPTKIACVGDSITYGSGIKGRDSLGYPQQMQRMLGKRYKIKNFGVSGATMLKKGNKPYWNQPEYQQSLDFKPKIIVLMLGTNDSKPINWDAYKDEFEKDYNKMISNFQDLRSKPKIYIGLPPPVIKNRWGIQKEIVEGELMEILNNIATENKLEVIDFYSILEDMNEMIPDNIHPNADGAKRMAIVAVSKIITTTN